MINWSNKKQVLKEMKLDGSKLWQATEDLRDDKEVVLAAIGSFRWAFRDASDRLKSDKAFVLESIKVNNESVCFIHPDLKKDREIAIAAVSVDFFKSDILYYFSEEIKSDPEVVLAAVSVNTLALFHASKELKEACKKKEPVSALKAYILDKALSKTNDFSFEKRLLKI